MASLIGTTAGVTPGADGAPPTEKDAMSQIARPGRSASLLLPALLVAALGCREAVDSPTAPDSEPALATAAAAGLSFIQVAQGGTHACAVAADRRAYCWGSNDQGQLGDGTTTGHSTPAPISGGLRFLHLSTGFQHSCGVTAENRVYCWGSNFDGQLGDGTGYPTNIRRLTPVAVAGTRRFRQVRAGHSFTCALTTSDAAFCWGINTFGQLGDGGGEKRTAPVRVKGGHEWRQLESGTDHVCAIRSDDRAYCWGMGFWGQLGTGTIAARRTPAEVSGGLAFRQITAGGKHSCGVTTQNRVYCWGDNNDGQVGDGTAYPPVLKRLTPVAVATERRFDHVMAGSDHTCGVAMSGRAFCWGWNDVGQLGDGTTTRRLKPVAVKGGLELDQLATFSSANLVRTVDGTLYRWGNNQTTPVAIPVP
jgi:alpha-tubulin suppressor-like RCC1 family protein